MPDRFLDALERRFGRFAIPGLVRVLVLFNALVFFLLLYNPRFITALEFDGSAVLSGEVWRLVTFLFLPPTANPLLLLIALYFLWIIGDGLEEAWGVFRLNLFFLITAGATVTAAFVFGTEATGFHINTFLFLSFATLYPNFTVLLFFILPVAVKWLGLMTFGFTAAEFVVGPPGVKAAIAAAALGYVLYFAPFFLARWRDRAGSAMRRGRLEKASAETVLHRCADCGATEASHPERDFRVTTDGAELCSECLRARRSGQSSRPDGSGV